MKFTPRKINLFMLSKIPSAYISGVRVTSISESEIEASVKFRWINQNPFRSMYWVTQGMASELTTGILVMKKIAESGERISMLVTNQKGNFTKKAVGRINFSCSDSDKIEKAINETVLTQEGQTITLESKGIDEFGDVVSTFEYEWSIKLKTSKGK